MPLENAKVAQLLIPVDDFDKTLIGLWTLVEALLSRLRWI